MGKRVEVTFGRGALLAATLAMLGCATTLPPIRDGAPGEHHVGQFVWFDLLTEKPAAARRFYEGVFGWEFDDSLGPAGYQVILRDGHAIGGLAEIDDELDATEAIWLGSLSVADVDVAAATTLERGGEVLEKPTEVGERGRMAIVRDPSGAVLALLRSATGDPEERAREVGDWLWVDLITPDAAGAQSFYGELVGYRTQDVEVRGGHVFQIMGRDGKARAGVVEVSWEEVTPNWLPYVAVGDLSATLDTVSLLGGDLLLRVGDAAIVADPTGAVLGLQQLAKGTK